MNSVREIGPHHGLPADSSMPVPAAASDSTIPRLAKSTGGISTGLCIASEYGIDVTGEVSGAAGRDLVKIPNSGDGNFPE